MTKGKVILGLLAGAAAGAAAGVLLAPGKGSETRKNLSQRGRDTVDNLKGKVTDIVETVADKYLAGTKPESRGRSTRSERSRSTGSDLAPGAPSTSSNSFS